MLPSQKWRLLVFLLTFIGMVPHLSALIGEARLYRGVEIQCLHGGPWIGQRYLGVYTRAQIYEEQVFTGTVRSVVETSFAERRLQIVPDEVLLGSVSGEITATMNQACLRENPPEIKSGDTWLFFVRTQYRDAIPYLVVDFDSPAKPVSLAQYDICLLRLRTDIDESCIPLMPARRQVPLHFVCQREWHHICPPISSPVLAQYQKPKSSWYAFLLLRNFAHTMPSQGTPQEILSSLAAGSSHAQSMTSCDSIPSACIQSSAETPCAQ